MAKNGPRPERNNTTVESLQVVIVEDESLVSQELVLLVSQVGHTVLGVVSHDEEAIQEVAQQRPDVVLCGVKGTEVDGIEFTKRLVEEYPVPVVLLDSEEGGNGIEAAEAGAFNYLSRPVTAGSLGAALVMAHTRFQEWFTASEELGQLRDTLETRKAAEQAKGVIMQRMQLPEAQAYAHLREKCRNQQKTMKQASLEIVEAERAFMETLSKEPASRMRPRYGETGHRNHDDRPHAYDRT